MYNTIPISLFQMFLLSPSPLLKNTFGKSMIIPSRENGEVIVSIQ